jgi:diadenosine tetraphosphatase ApaH/serine/threonine PP2A family protein phosphatase
MRALILSDIHANLEALQAVLAAAAGQWDELWNLGDLVGYGGSPNEVIDMMRPLETLVVRGNHDRVCCGITSPNAFNPTARAAATWTREQLSRDNLDWLREIPKGPILPAFEGVNCVHGSPLDEDSYILTMRDAWAPLQQMATPITFFGHTHIQGGFSQKDHDWHELRPYNHPANGHSYPGDPNMAVSYTVALPPGTRHLINPGSVGQPRDRDWRAAFAIFDSGSDGAVPTITFHRVPYDLVASQGRILMAGLPDRLAARLREGR